MPATATVLSYARVTLRAILLAAVAGWTFDAPGRLGLAFYTEQFLALVLGLCTSLVLIDPRPGQSPRAHALSGIMAAIVLTLFGYVTYAYPALQLNLVTTPPAAVALGLVMIAGVLEATRRTTGPFLPILVMAMVGLVFAGPYLPATYQTRPVSFSRLVVYLGLDTNALFGKILEIGAIVVVPFIVFGFLLNAFGGSAFFSALAARAVGGYRGGPAKVSVAGSAAFGMVSGSVVANVVAVGSVSIPMMARAGYQRHVAAAIEAISSTGGQLMPPIMGAAAFLMAELLEVSYQSIVVAAILPSLLFYLALFLAVDFEARRLDIKTSAKDVREMAGEGGRIRGWRFLIPIGILLYLLFVQNRTAEYAGGLSVLALLAVHITYPFNAFWPRIKRGISVMLDAMGTLPDIIMIAATAGLIIGVLNITGISFAITVQMLILSNNSLPLLLLITAVLSIILGLGMPTVGVYVLLATLAAPALIKLGVDPLAAHFYVQYFGMLSMITPPIAIASFAAASVAGADPWKTSFASLRIGAGVYLIPVAFVLEPELLFIGSLGDTAIAAVRATVSVVALTAAALGHGMRPIPSPMRLVGVILAVVNLLPLGIGVAGLLEWSSFIGAIAFTAYYVRPLRVSAVTQVNEA